MPAPMPILAPVLIPALDELKEACVVVVVGSGVVVLSLVVEAGKIEDAICVLVDGVVPSDVVMVLLDEDVPVDFASVMLK